MYGWGWGWVWMWLGGVVLILILAALVVLIVRGYTVGAASPNRHTPQAPTSSARQILEERFARGEISPDEFQQLIRVLAEHTGNS